MLIKFSSFKSWFTLPLSIVSTNSTSNLQFQFQKTNNGINEFFTNIVDHVIFFSEPVSFQTYNYIETSLLICKVNQWSVFFINVILDWHVLIWVFIDYWYNTHPLFRTRKRPDILFELVKRKNQEFDNAVEFTTSENTVDIRCLELPRGQRKISRLNLMIYEYAVIQVAAK